MPQIDINPELYKIFRAYCRDQGVSLGSQTDQWVAERSGANEEHLKETHPARQISIRGLTYAKLKAYCDAQGVTVSSQLNQWVAEKFGVHEQHLSPRKP